MVHVPKKYRKLFQDSIVVTIPLDVTADLGVAIQHTRQKRIRALQEHFPSLKPADQVGTIKSPDETVTSKMDLSDTNNNGSDEEDDEKARARSNAKSRPGMLQPGQYGSVVDYLEAKYVRGVMLQDDSEEDEDEEDDRGSVYDSENSFVDDSLLRRDLAHQVLSQSTHTKLELQNNDDDFFVNVGNLEVEGNDLMEYDPLLDEQKTKKATKRKRPTSTDSKAAPKKPKAGQKEGTKSTSLKKPDAPGSDDAEPAVDLSELQKSAAERKAEKDKLYKTIVDQIKKMTNDELPRKKRMVKISIVIPEGKSSGDKITFTNPNDPGQKLCVTAPKNKTSGDKFFVSVPMPPPSDVTDNKFPREFQHLIVDYATTYDAWCDSEAKYHQADPDRKGKYKIKQTKTAKFDGLVNEFPNEDLVAPVDTEMLRLVLRRVRQNISKRKKVSGAAKDDTEVASSTAAAAKDPGDAKPRAKKLKIGARPITKSKLKKPSSPKARPHVKSPAKPKPSVAKPKLDSVHRAAETIPIRVPGKGAVFSQFEMGSVEEFG